MPGNHEYYSLQTREHTDQEWKRKAREHAGLHYLLAEGVVIGGVRFWGAPWYSDFFGRRDSELIEKARERVNDFEAQYDDHGQWSVVRHLNEHARPKRSNFVLIRRRSYGWMLAVLVLLLPGNPPLSQES